MSKKIDLTGQTINRLVVLREAGRSKSGAVTWLCRCLGRQGDYCGKEVVVRTDDLRSGKTKSCGCLKLERVTTHGLCVKHGRTTTHGLTLGHRRLLCSITRHIGYIRDPYAHGHKHYKHLRIPAKYLGASGAARFAQEVIKRYPKEAEEYEHDKSLELDKDISGEFVFAPWNIRFVPRKENRNYRRDTLRLDDGTPLAMFCASLGISTIEKGKATKQYTHIRYAWRSQHKPHPELMQALKEDTDRQSRLLEMTKLKIRHAELMIKGLKKLTTPKSDTP